MTGFKSKRNDVRLEVQDGRNTVVKRFRQPEDWKREYERYRRLQKAKVRVPKVLQAEPGCLILSYIEGKTALELLEQQERQNMFQPEVWKALAHWVSNCVGQTGFLMKDMNPGNFIYVEDERCFYGIDFEGETAEDTAQAVGMLLGFLGMADPADTPFKQKLCDYLKEQFCETIQLLPEAVEQKVKEARAMMRHRRKRIGMLEINDSFICPVLTEHVHASRYGQDGQISKEDQELLKEHLLEVVINGTPVLNMACTPVYLAELVLGHLLTGGFIRAVEEVKVITISQDGKWADVRMAEGWNAAAEKKAALRPVMLLDWKTEWISDFCRMFQQDTPLHRLTESTHSCFLSHDGQICFQSEDIGRHNAVDKAVGYALRYDIDLSRCALYTSGRMPTDMVEKVIRAGIPLLAGKEAPTVEGAALAREYGLTLIGRAKNGQMVRYTEI